MQYADPVPDLVQPMTFTSYNNQPKPPWIKAMEDAQAKTIADFQNSPQNRAKVAQANLGLNAASMAGQYMNTLAAGNPLSAGASALGQSILANPNPINDATANRITQRGVDQMAGGYNQAMRSLNSGLAARGLAGSPLAAAQASGLAMQTGEQASNLARETGIDQATKNFAGRMAALDTVGRYGQSQENMKLGALQSLLGMSQGVTDQNKMTGVLAPGVSRYGYSGYGSGY